MHFLYFRGSGEKFVQERRPEHQGGTEEVHIFVIVVFNGRLVVSSLTVLLRMNATTFLRGEKGVFY